MEKEEIRKNSRSKGSKATRFVFFVVFIFVLSAISSVLADKYFFPWLATHDGFKDNKFFKKGLEDVMVINKTEQVTVNESQTIAGFTDKSASSVVEIALRQKGGKNQTLDQNPPISGIIVTADGLVMSYDNKFFDGKDSEYKVFAQDGKSFDATVAAKDPFSNLVLLKLVGAENLPVSEFISPDDIRVGMKTAVVSRSGFNSEISLRLGIASEWAKADSISGPLASSEKLQGVLLLDSDSANQPNEDIAGGAAVDYNGNIIGIVGEKKESAGSSFFIVPINNVQDTIKQYLDKGKIERGTLGVYYVSLSKETAYLANNSFDRGALVFSSSAQQGLAVIAGSAAEKAGLKLGDVILSVNGEEVNPDQNLAALISKYHPGDAVALKVIRDGKETEVKAALQ